jgi:hypothetical protein|tara:strand:+ start:726 stop:905 length:180 start_codon:yes stop_codon:yes gene_type:complete
MFPGTPNLVARRTGIERVLFINELISLSQKIDMSQKPVAEKYFVYELEWVQGFIQIKYE